MTDPVSRGGFEDSVGCKVPEGSENFAVITEALLVYSFQWT